MKFTAAAATAAAFMVLGCLPAHARIGEIHNAKPGDCANVSLGGSCYRYGPLGGTHKERISNKELAVYSRAGGSVPIGNDCHRVHMKNAEKVGWESSRNVCFSGGSLKLPPCSKVNLEKGFEVYTRTYKVYKVIGICKGCGPKSLTVKVVDEGSFWQYRGPYADLINIRKIAGTCS